LVLLDLYLPEMSGEEIFDVIRKNSKSAIVTADILAAPEFIEKADGVFTKPFKTPEMIVKLNSLLAKGRKREGE
jgi:CheY-like chemotaxis protein